jgi:hypothetical protein
MPIPESIKSNIPEAASQSMRRTMLPIQLAAPNGPRVTEDPRLIVVHSPFAAYSP